MSAAADLPPVRHDPGAARFLIEVEGHQAELTYQLTGGGVMVIDHTGVPGAIGGRGIAAALVKAAFDYARSQGWKVRPACSYAATWATRHGDYADVVEH